MTTIGQQATYVEAQALHLIVPGRTWQQTDLAKAIADRAMPSPFRPHIPPGWGADPHPLPKTFDEGRDLLLVTRQGMLHSQHRSDDDLANWMSAGGWRAAYVDGISSVVRTQGPAISVTATPDGLTIGARRIVDCVSFCLRKLRYGADDEALVSADEALTAQACAAGFQPLDREVHLSHVAAIAAHIDAEFGNALTPGAFADVAASRSAISGITRNGSSMRMATGEDARTMAKRIYDRLTRAEARSA